LISGRAFAFNFSLITFEHEMLAVVEHVIALLVNVS
jgi:hypothetical protein